jgi:hypothetical protein
MECTMTNTTVRFSLELPAKAGQNTPPTLYTGEIQIDVPISLGMEICITEFYDGYEAKRDELIFVTVQNIQARRNRRSTVAGAVRTYLQVVCSVSDSMKFAGNQVNDENEPFKVALRSLGWRDITNVKQLAFIR